MHLTTLYCYTCRKKFLDPLNSACRPEAVNKAKLAIVSNMHKFEEHVDTNCFICVQFSEGEQNPSVTAEGDNNTTVFSFQNHLEALEITCSLCAKIDKHNLKTYTFAWARIKAEFDHIMDINRSSIHPRPKKELFCFTCRKGFLEPFNKCKNDASVEKHVEKLLGQLYIFKGHSEYNCHICCEYDIYQRKQGEDSQTEDTAEAEALLPPEDQELYPEPNRMMDDDDDDAQIPTQTEYDRSATSPVPTLPSIRRHRPAIENVKKLVLCKANGVKVEISSGNCNLGVEHFLDQEAATLYRCCMCNNLFE